jgi:hypothetical protein
MKRIALITILTAAVAIFGVINTSSAETTVPIDDLTIVSETSTAAAPITGVEPDALPRFQFPRFQFPRFQFPRFQFPRFQFPRFQFPRFQNPRFQFPRFQFPRFQFPRFQFPRFGRI